MQGDARMEVKVRLMKREEDIPLVAAIVQKEVYNELSQDEMEDWLKNSANPPYLQSFVAERIDREVVGFISWSLSDMRDKQIIMEIDMIAVKAEYQRKGIGSKLLQKTFEKVRNLWKKGDLEVVTIRTETDGDNRMARNFFSKILDRLGDIRETTTPRVWETTQSGEDDIIQYFVRFFF
jgi:ribosomal protein S18 acetylase RimI-like enzyme